MPASRSLADARSRKSAQASGSGSPGEPGTAVGGVVASRMGSFLGEPKSVCNLQLPSSIASCRGSVMVAVGGKAWSLAARVASAWVALVKLSSSAAASTGFGLGASASPSSSSPPSGRGAAVGGGAPAAGAAMAAAPAAESSRVSSLGGNVASVRSSVCSGPTAAAVGCTVGAPRGPGPRRGVSVTSLAALLPEERVVVKAAPVSRDPSVACVEAVVIARAGTRASPRDVTVPKAAAAAGPALTVVGSGRPVEAAATEVLVKAPTKTSLLPSSAGETTRPTAGSLLGHRSRSKAGEDSMSSCADRSVQAAQHWEAEAPMLPVRPRTPVSRICCFEHHELEPALP
mmetsp:Transcript_76495/g.241896  ORF Transcript_76495/g.241896 Transcript_76495/m.241896 type:complete len:344 (-) Transcript_76495:2-1033(-)